MKAMWMKSRQDMNLRSAKESYASRRRRAFQRSLTIGLLPLTIIGSVLISVIWGETILSYLSDPMKMRAMVANRPLASRLIFFLAIVFQVVVAIIPGEPFELAAGYAFGAVEGTLICMAAIYAASILIFLAVKRFGRPVIELFFEPERIDEIRLFR
ncbi:MAG TPA: hypothetical protein VFD19_02225, partial [Clostridia bacterium]|nr:hypothetical protein [Clostridia bacterium]